MTLEQKQKTLLVGMAKQSYTNELFAGTSGNLSIYDREKDKMIITPTSVAYNEMTADDAVSMKLDGTILSGHLAPSSEWQMHASIYKNRRDITAIVHTHSPYATSFAVTHQPIPVILIEMIPFLGGDIPVAEFALPGTEALGLESLKVLEDRYSCLLANHGTLAIGDTLQKAYIRAIYVEDAAKICALALSHGSAFPIANENIQKMIERSRSKKGA
jgi:L-fuculose-phosphate aldolase/L-ribulose-5-phosphate 4-epimerase